MYTNERHFGYVRVYVDTMFGGLPLVKMDWQVATADLVMAETLHQDLSAALVYARSIQAEIDSNSL